ncbi:unnamed protein product [Paramecium octaurelia]|uniref:Uncharacterized protein n=1 Tax=Paramecium octaurelia TaxID=43137 RepID=A0A8S1VZG7_PAROT|nr:unnamed protein product [Paramecium octaurelia]
MQQNRLQSSVQPQTFNPQTKTLQPQCMAQGLPQGLPQAPPPQQFKQTSQNDGLLEIINQAKSRETLRKEECLKKMALINTNFGERNYN